MESTITGTIESVKGREVSSGVIYDVTIDGDKISTFKNHLAEEARLMEGSTVTAAIGVTEKNGYTNRTLLGIKLVNATGTTNGTTSSIPVTAEKKGWQPEDTERVTKLSCISSACALMSGAGSEATGDVLTLAQQFYKVAMGTSAPEPAALAVQGHDRVALSSTEASDGIPW